MSRPITKLDNSPLTPLSQRFAAWAIPRLPGWLTPNQVTVFGFAMITLAGLCLSMVGVGRGWLLAAAACVTIHWLSDDLDGELARAKGMTSERGMFLDLSLDCLGATLLCLGLAFSGLTNTVLALLFLVCFLLAACVALLHIVLRGRFPLGRLGPSEAQLSLATLCVLVYLWPGLGATALGVRLSIVDLALLATIALNIADWSVAIMRLWRELEGPR